MNASIDKAITPLLAAAATALLGLATGQAVDFAGLYTAVLSAVSGLLAASVVYFIRYHATRPNKAVAAALPLAIALVHALQTGQVNEPEILLGMQGVVGFIATYVASRVESPADPAPSRAARRSR